MKKFPFRAKRLRTAFRTADSALFSFLICLPLFLQRPLRRQPALCVLLYFAVLAAVMLLRTKIKERKSRAEQNGEAERHALERLLLSDDESLRAATGEPGFLLIRSLHPDVCDLAEAVRNGADAIGVLELTRETRAFIARNAPHWKVWDRSALLRLFGINPPEKRFLFKENRFFNKYFFLGCLLFAASPFVHYKIYFRSVASLCLIFSAVTGFFRKWNIMKKM